jgi:anti-anti-sigma factor
VQIHVEINGRVAVLKISGGMIFDESLFLLREHVQNLLESEIRRVVVDISEVPHIDSSGCGEVIRIYTSIVKANGALAFVNPTERVRVLWTRIKLTDVFHVFNTLDEALSFVQMSEAGAAG